MWEDNSYCWVVLCKNNCFTIERIYSPSMVSAWRDRCLHTCAGSESSFTVRCDECHKEYLYKPSDVLRHDRELPASFIPHPLFQLDFMPRAVELTEQKPSRLRRVRSPAQRTFAL